MTLCITIISTPTGLGWVHLTLSTVTGYNNFNPYRVGMDVFYFIDCDRLQ